MAENVDMTVAEYQRALRAWNVLDCLVYIPPEHYAPGVYRTKLQELVKELGEALGVPAPSTGGGGGGGAAYSSMDRAPWELQVMRRGE